MSTICPGEVRFSNLSLVDEVGRVFHWKDGIYRGIYAAAAQQVRELFASGCLEELMRRGLFPETKITDHTLEGFAFVVEHEALPFVTYPHEWPFDMFRDAALAVLEISEVTARFGWRLKDCHPYNVLFDGTRAVYVDLGSIIPATPDSGFTLAADFLNCYWWPLSIWASGNYFLAQRIISSAHEMMSVESWSLYRSSLIPRLGPSLARRYRSFLGGRGILRISKMLGRVFPKLATRLPLELLKHSPALLRLKFSNMATPPPMTFWHNYHDEYFNNGELASTPRFDRILEIVRSLGCESVVELAGNQGLLSLLLLMKTPLRRVICTDYDSSAINRLYGHCCKPSALPTGKTFQPAVINFVVPEINYFTVHPAERFRSDLVIALAITHHLVLAQNFRLREVLRSMAAYTRKYALVEFMPLGLWDGHRAPPVPDWYCPEWFRQTFSEFFDLLHEEQVETNRLVFLGQLKVS